MNDDRARLARLAQIAALKRDVETQALAAANAEIGALEQQVARLRKSLRLRSRTLELDPSRLSGADVPWTRRTEIQVAELQRRIAAAMVRREEALGAARLAVGRAEAVEELLRRARTDPRKDWSQP